MFMIFLRFSTNKADAPQHMAGHKAWIEQGVADGTFLVVGSLQPDAGGAILAHGGTLADMQARVDRDPFVAEDVVAAEVLEIAPNRADPRLTFLMG